MGEIPDALPNTPNKQDQKDELFEKIDVVLTSVTPTFFLLLRSLKKNTNMLRTVLPGDEKG